MAHGVRPMGRSPDPCSSTTCGCCFRSSKAWCDEIGTGPHPRRLVKWPLITAHRVRPPDRQWRRRCDVSSGPASGARSQPPAISGSESGPLSATFLPSSGTDGNSFDRRRQNGAKGSGPIANGSSTVFCLLIIVVSGFAARCWRRDEWSDSFSQSWPEIAMHYCGSRQTTSQIEI